VLEEAECQGRHPVAGCVCHVDSEFLKERTTCACEMLKKITCKKNCQKGPRLSGGRQGHAAIPNTGRSPDGRRRRPPLHAVGPAATAKASMLAWQMPPGGAAAPPHADSQQALTPRHEAEADSLSQTALIPRQRLIQALF
jgi:hypothetical protein